MNKRGETQDKTEFDNRYVLPMMITAISGNTRKKAKLIIVHPTTGGTIGHYSFL